MTTPTIIRSKEIGNKLGLVVTTFGLGEFEARFQLYTRGTANKRALILVRSDVFDGDPGAIKLFNAWVKESGLLLAAGDI